MVGWRRSPEAFAENLRKTKCGLADWKVRLQAGLDELNGPVQSSSFCDSVTCSEIYLRDRKASFIVEAGRYVAKVKEVKGRNNQNNLMVRTVQENWCGFQFSD